MKYVLISLLLFAFACDGQTLVFEKDSSNTAMPTMYAIPVSHGYINDKEHVFSVEEASKLIKYMKQAGMDSTAVSVLTITEIKPFKNLEELATAYANSWELGLKNKNGILITFSKTLKQSRVQVGEIYETKFTAEVLKEIDQLMIPEFVKGDYYTGTLNALKKINTIINK
jgi:uncharacterized membrane protein YgcG